MLMAIRMTQFKRPSKATTSGFTLIEISIVLVIIGLIVGGILTGQDLIRAAGIRAQIAQIEKYHTAVRTFQGKYGYLPGDIPDPYAGRFGFVARGSYAGEGDGNGLLAGISSNSAGSDQGNKEAAGELGLFWVDLSQAGLIDGSFNTVVATSLPASDATGATIGNYFPSAKIGNGNYVYTWGGGSSCCPWTYTGINYYGISNVSLIAGSTNFGKVTSSAGLSVLQALNIDTKADDGLPQTGSIIAVYLNIDPRWTDGTNMLSSGPSTAATAASSTTCYDNGNVNNATQKYSTAQNGGSGVNCGLSFRFQ